MTRSRRRVVIGFAVLVFVMLFSQDQGMPVRAEVEWKGGNMGPYEHDPRVAVLRKYTVQAYAANNALNYSGVELRKSASSYFLTAISSRVKNDYVTPIDARLWEGPPSFRVMGIERIETEGDEAAVVTVCLREAPWWSPDKEWENRAQLVEEREGLYRFDPVTFRDQRYELRKFEHGWKVDAVLGGGDECDPGEVAIGTFATPPDLDLLHEATPDMVIGPDGRPVE